MWLKTDDIVIQGQKLLRYYSLYALIMSLMLVTIDGLDSDNRFFGATNPNAFLFANIAYILWAVFMLVISSQKSTTPPQYAAIFFLGDITILTIMMKASGGLESGFSNLILISILVSNLLVSRTLGYFVAAWTTLAVIYTQHISSWSFVEKEVFTSGLYGFFCFILAFLTQTLSGTLSSTMRLTVIQEANISRLRKINEHALYSLPDALIACDRNHKILLINNMAKQWFNLKEGTTLPAYLNDDPTANKKKKNKKKRHFTHEGHNLIANISPLHNSQEGDYILVIEDARHIAAEAQQIKLASLGRLTASIAHEIRNPLSALRHAAQLLAEAPDLSKSDLKLTNIIEQHCMRINRTIEDILQISRRSQAGAEIINLKSCLDDFVINFRQSHQEKFSLSIKCDSKFKVSFDPNQLQRVLHNICGNGLRYALAKNSDNAEIKIKAQRHTDGAINLYLMDNGSGIDEENQKKLFEPFFTTEHTGTGLGLYLCREICSANEAGIKFIPNHNLSSGSCFRLTFSNS